MDLSELKLINQSQDVGAYFDPNKAPLYNPEDGNFRVTLKVEDRPIKVEEVGFSELNSQIVQPMLQKNI